jgi:hypothetical protein
MASAPRPPSKPENHRPGGVAAAPIPPSLARGCPEEQMRWLHLMPRRGAVAVDLVLNHGHDSTPRWALLHNTVAADSYRVMQLNPL